MSGNWIEQKERSNTLTLKLICWLALNLGRCFARVWLYPITLYFFLTAPKVRKASSNYLRRVPGWTGNYFQIAKHIYWFAATVLDRVFFLTDKNEKFELQINGAEVIDRQIESGKGFILLGSHLGSFEVLRCLAVNRGHFPLKILMYHDHNQMITKILDALNPQVADTVINLGDAGALLKMKECVDAGDMIGMLGDRVAESDKTVRCRLLGDEITLPAGPMLLATTLRVPVVLFFALYRGGNKYEIFFEEFSERVDIQRNQREEGVRVWTQKYVNRIEHYIKYAPLNWFNFYDYWDDEA